jgi:catalase
VRIHNVKSQTLTNATGAPVPDNTNILTARHRGPALLQDIWLIQKLAHFDREVVSERRIHAKGWERMELSPTTHDITSTPKRQQCASHEVLERACCEL